MLLHYWEGIHQNNCLWGGCPLGKRHSRKLQPPPGQNLLILHRESNYVFSGELFSVKRLTALKYPLLFMSIRSFTVLSVHRILFFQVSSFILNLRSTKIAFLGGVCFKLSFRCTSLISRTSSLNLDSNKVLMIRHSFSWDKSNTFIDTFVDWL